MQAQPRRLVAIEQAGDALGDEIVRSAAPVDAARGVVAHDRVEPEPGAQHRGRHIEQFGEGAVPGDQRQVGVEHGDALARVVERMLQQVAARLDGGRGVVEHL